MGLWQLRYENLNVYFILCGKIWGLYLFQWDNISPKSFMRKVESGNIITASLFMKILWFSFLWNRLRGLGSKLIKLPFFPHLHPKNIIITYNNYFKYTIIKSQKN